MSYLNVDDLQLLRERGFMSGPTGQAWYGEDKYEDMWRVYVDERSDRLMFSVETSEYLWGPNKIMKREDFDELFTKDKA